MDMNARFGYAAYQQGQVGSANPLRIVVLLYEGAIRFIGQAQASWPDPSVRGAALGRAHRIVSELLASLDYEKGGDIAANLDGLYHFILDEITRANVTGSQKRLDGVTKVLRELLAGWTSIEANARAPRGDAASGNAGASAR
jgi:flagellar secretion chaperone FliS